MKIHLALLSALLMSSTLSSIPSVSAAEAAGINQRQENQRQSIRSGIEDGSLTRREAGRLGQSQARFERMEQRMRADGELTRRERTKLRGTADANRASIYRQRNDAQTR